MSRLVVAVTLLAGALGSGCAPAIEPQPQDSGTPASQTVTEDLYLAQTAAHICQVQGTVYPDQASLAAAFEKLPDYDIPQADVDRLNERLRTDPVFSRVLNEKIAQECG